MYTLLHFLKNKNDANFEGGEHKQGLTNEATQKQPQAHDWSGKWPVSSRLCC